VGGFCRGLLQGRGTRHRRSRQFRHLPLPRCRLLRPRLRTFLRCSCHQFRLRQRRSHQCPCLRWPSRPFPGRHRTRRRQLAARPSERCRRLLRRRYRERRLHLPCLVRALRPPSSRRKRAPWRGRRTAADGARGGRWCFGVAWVEGAGRRGLLGLLSRACCGGSRSVFLQRLVDSRHHRLGPHRAERDVRCPTGQPRSARSAFLPGVSARCFCLALALPASALVQVGS